MEAFGVLAGVLRSLLEAAGLLLPDVSMVGGAEPAFLGAVVEVLPVDLEESSPGAAGEDGLRSAESWSLLEDVDLLLGGVSTPGGVEPALSGAPLEVLPAVFRESPLSLSST